MITFNRHFTAEEQDKGLKDRLKEAENISGLLNWCIEGLKKYYAEGATPPLAVYEATKEYRTNSDKIGNFISECLEKSGENSSIKTVYEKYIEWCQENGFGAENKSNFTAELNSKGIVGVGLINGMTYKKVVRGYTVGRFDPVEDAKNIPFTQ